MIKDGIDSTVIVSDIRNFTGLFETFQKGEDGRFIDFVADFYNIQREYAVKLTWDNFKMIKVGDSVVTIFTGENHSLLGYKFILKLYQELSDLCTQFKTYTGYEVGFGIGADCGHVWKVSDTYLGSVINRATRIQDRTKDFGDTNAIISGNLYKALIERIYPTYDVAFVYDSKDYDTVLADNPDFIKIGEELLLYYIFKLNLKGIANPLPIFRLSHDLITNKSRVNTTIETLNNTIVCH